MTEEPAKRGRRTSFACEQISVDCNDVAYRKSKYTQKLAGVKVTSDADEVWENGKLASLNDYYLLKTLGKGAFGEVKLATKDLVEDDLSEDHDRFAIKIIKRPQQAAMRKSFTGRRSIDSAVSMYDSVEVEDSQQRETDSWLNDVPEAFRQEVNIMKLLAHKNLVRLVEILFSTRSDDAQCYLVLEHIEGGTIMVFDQKQNKYVYRLTGKVLGEATARRSFRDLVSGLAYMHANHIAHRDIKPDNLLIDFKGNLKLADFGVAMHFEADRKKASIPLSELKRSISRGMVLKTEGTFPFYSPEMCGERASAFSAYLADTWAASVCLWIFIFGVLPFQHRDVTELFRLIRNDDPMRPHRVSPELDDLLTASLHKKIEKRPYVHDIRFHCWVTEETLISYKNRVGLLSDHEFSLPESTPRLEELNSAIALEMLLNDCADYAEILPEYVVSRLRELAEAARRTCSARHDAFELAAKNEINVLVRKAMNDGVDPLEHVGAESSEWTGGAILTNGSDVDIDLGAISLGSDPFALMASRLSDSDDGLTDASPSRRSSSADQERRRSSRVLRFQTLDVLGALEMDDELGRASMSKRDGRGQESGLSWFSCLSCCCNDQKKDL